MWLKFKAGLNPTKKFLFTNSNQNYGLIEGLRKIYKIMQQEDGIPMQWHL